MIGELRQQMLDARGKLAQGQTAAQQGAETAQKALPAFNRQQEIIRAATSIGHTASQTLASARGDLLLLKQLLSEGEATGHSMEDAGSEELKVFRTAESEAQTAHDIIKQATGEEMNEATYPAVYARTTQTGARVTQVKGQRALAEFTAHKTTTEQLAAQLGDIMLTLEELVEKLPDVGRGGDAADAHTQHVSGSFEQACETTKRFALGLQSIDSRIANW